MNPFKIKKILPVLGILAAFSLSNCSKEKLSNPIPPLDTNQGVTTNSASLAVGTDALDSLKVITFYQGGFSTLKRICSAANQTLFVTAAGSIVKITPAGVGSTLTSGLQNLIGIKSAPNGDLYVADFGGDFSNYNKVVKVDQAGNKSEVKTPDGKPLDRIFAPRDIAVDDNNALYVLNTGGNTVTRINSEKLFDVVGKLGANTYVDGVGYAAHLVYPSSLKFSKDGNLYMVDDSLGFMDTYVTNPNGGYGPGGRSIRMLNLAQRKLTTIYRATGDRRIMDIAVAKKDQNFKTTNKEGIFAVFSDNSISYISTEGVEVPLTTNTQTGLVNGSLRTARFGFLTGICIHENFMDVVDMTNHAIRRITRK